MNTDGLLETGSNSTTITSFGSWEGTDSLTKDKMEWKSGEPWLKGSPMQYLKKLILSRPFLSRMPDTMLLADNPYDPIGQLVATSGEGYAMVYIPTGKIVKIDLSHLPFEMIKIWWYNPRSGKALEASIQPNLKNTFEFDPPGETGRGNDWVLVLDNAERKFTTPGSF